MTIAANILVALGVLAMLATGVRMMARPELYLGEGHPPARDPRTVIWFGRLFTAFAVITTLLFLIKFWSE